MLYHEPIDEEEYVNSMWEDVINREYIENEFLKSIKVKRKDAMDNSKVDVLTMVHDKLFRMGFSLEFHPNPLKPGFALDIDIGFEEENQTTSAYFDDTRNCSFCAKSQFEIWFDKFIKMLLELLIKLPLPQYYFPYCGRLIFSSLGMVLILPDGQMFRSIYTKKQTARKRNRKQIPHKEITEFSRSIDDS